MLWYFKTKTSFFVPWHLVKAPRFTGSSIKIDLMNEYFKIWEFVKGKSLRFHFSPVSTKVGKPVLDKALKFQGHPAVAQHYVLSGVQVEEERWNEHTIASSTWPKDCCYLSKILQSEFAARSLWTIASTNFAGSPHNDTQPSHECPNKTIT